MNRPPFTPAKTTATVVAAALATLISTGAATAGNVAKDITLKPGNGMSFVVGNKRATTYFNENAGQCDVTVLVSEATWKVSSDYVPASRMRVKLAPGSNTRVDSFEGKSVSFTCNVDAKSMTVRNEQLTVSSLAR